MTSGRNILLSAAFAVVGSAIASAQMTTGWLEQWHKAKHGRSSPREEARLKSELQSSAFRAESPPSPGRVSAWFEDQRHRTKYGRTAPSEEARLETELQNSASRQEAKPDATLQMANDWLRDQWHRGKYGRPAPSSEQ